MPPKAGKKNGRSDNQEVADKIKDLKIRQQTWLKPDSDKAKASEVKNFQQSSNGWSDKRLEHDTVGKQSDGFSAWLERRTPNNNISGSRCNTASTALDLPSASEESAEEAEEVEAVADRIISKVKNEIKAGSQVAVIRPQASQRDGKVDSRANTITKQFEKTDGGHPDSHYCSVCRQLMVLPLCAPVLMVPCGDTACSQCTQRGDQCPVCKSFVRSTTSNIMLQQIIEQYRREKSSPGVRSHEFKRERTYNLEDYNNLKLRYEILEGEQCEILREIEKLDLKKGNEEKQIENIEKQKQKLEEQIQELRERQQILEMHKTAYVDNCSKIEEKKSTEKRKLNLLRTTLSDLRGELTQMKVSVQSYPHS